MAEIILAFFAVLGIGLLGSLLFDALYYKKQCLDLPLLVDLRESDLEEAWNTLEAISFARKYPSGKAILRNVYVLVSTTNRALTEDLAYHYLRVFDLPGTVFTEHENWFSAYQNTPVKEGTNS